MEEQNINITKSIQQLSGYQNFLYFGASIFKKTLSDLMNCSVKIWSHNLQELKDIFKVDIFENINRICYIIDENTMILSIKIKENNEIKALVPLILEGTRIGRMNGHLINRLGNTICHVMSDCYKTSFFQGQILLSDNMVRMMISNCFSKYSFNTNNINYLISYLRQLCSTTFENEHFKTGFIITRSIYAYGGKNGSDRQGTLDHLTKVYSMLVEPNPDKRFWFLVDGNKSFYLCDQRLQIRDVFIRNDDNSQLGNFVDSYSLAYTLLGNDVAFRVINKNQYSILCSDGIEFINIENIWKIRDYKLISTFLEEKTNMSKRTVGYLLFYILLCSQNNVSSIIFIPNDSYHLYDGFITHNELYENPLSILNETHRTVLKRIVASDGATVISREGIVLSHGCIVDLAELNATGLIGTGESAARLLSKMGTSIKISKDGGIKIFFDINQNPLKF